MLNGLQNLLRVEVNDFNLIVPADTDNVPTRHQTVFNLVIVDLLQRMHQFHLTEGPNFNVTGLMSRYEYLVFYIKSVDSGCLGN
jgi:hypothetical protein